MVVDVSGDGSSNRGLPVSVARAELLARGIVINGLAVTNQEAGLEAYYAREVIEASVAERKLARAADPFMVTVWEHFDESLLRTSPLDERLSRWQSWGVNRVILLMFRGVDLEAIERAGKQLRRR